MRRQQASLPTLDDVAAELERRRSQKAAAVDARHYHDAPAKWVQECLLWREGEAAAPYQLDALEQLAAKRREAIRSPHAAGKTTTAAWAILWFATTRDLAGEDWKVPTTASAWRQLTRYLWPEVHKWARRINWLRLGREPFVSGRDLLTQSLHLRTGIAFAAASDVPELIEGAHADQILYIFDEAKAIPDRTWDATEGAFAGTGAAYALAISTPGEPVGRFYAIQARKPGYEDWTAVHVTVEQMLAAGRQKAEWVEQRRIQWGTGSAVFQNRVLGEFASSEAEGVIPLSWVEAAIARWHVWYDSLGLAETAPVSLSAIGVDVARSGDDESIEALLAGLVITELRRPPGNQDDTMQLAGHVAALLSAHTEAEAVIDIVGVGAGVFDRLREQGARVLAFVASARAEYSNDQPITDRTGELGFVNMRAAAWWHLRELLDPLHGEQVCLPPDDLLIGDLTAPHWKLMSGGKVQVESKDDIRQRIGRSTDRGDAVVQAFAAALVRQPQGKAVLW